MKAVRVRQTSAASSTGSRVSAAVALAAGGVLRGWMLRKFFEVNGDSELYGGMAKNLLLHGQYALSDPHGVLHSTLIRLPGYPLFLAACFRLFGMENYWAAAVAQILFGLLGCVFLGMFAARISPRAYRTAAAQATLWLAALCPFTAVYDAEPLTESLSLFCIALALWSAARFWDHPGWRSAVLFTVAVTYSALLRPDGALVGLALGPAVLLSLFAPVQNSRAQRAFQLAGKESSDQPAEKESSVTGHDFSRAEDDDKEKRALAPEGFSGVPNRVRLALVCLLLALAPFAAWTWRNWRVFHVIQPLAPRYATDPGENTWPGWQRWVKTWSLDFVSTYEVYWSLPGGSLEISKLPSRAFDSPGQYAETARLFADYESNGEELSPDLDARFDRLAKERIAARPLRYYAMLPLGRVADMWLRPRVENLPIDLDWWVYGHHRLETRFSWFYAGLNALYLSLAIAGLCLRPRLWPWMLGYMVLRSALLATVEAPEARYTLECFPMMFALGGVAISRLYFAVRRQELLS
jgi:Dolichyl-phosphate-mannose-protein mannosyltransferase